MKNETIAVYCVRLVRPQNGATNAVPIIAGYETTSTAISYSLYEIARNPAVQQKLHEEVDAFGQDREPSFDDLSSFPYAEAVFHEGMRLHPPVTPFIALVGSWKFILNVLQNLSAPVPCLDAVSLI